MAKRKQIYQGRFEELRDGILLGANEAEHGELLEAAAVIDALRQRLRSRHIEL